MDTCCVVGVEVSGWSVGICGRGLGGATGEITGVGRRVGTRDRERNIQDDMVRWTDIRDIFCESYTIIFRGNAQKDKAVILHFCLQLFWFFLWYQCFFCSFLYFLYFFPSPLLFLSPPVHFKDICNNFIRVENMNLLTKTANCVIIYN